MSELSDSPLTCGDVSFERGHIARLAAGLELALADLGIKDRNDPMTNLLAKLIIQLAEAGGRDPTSLAKRAIGIVRNST